MPWGRVGGEEIPHVLCGRAPTREGIGHRSGSEGRPEGLFHRVGGGRSADSARKWAAGSGGISVNQLRDLGS